MSFKFIESVCQKLFNELIVGIINVKWGVLGIFQSQAISYSTDGGVVQVNTVFPLEAYNKFTFDTESDILLENIIIYKLKSLSKLE